MRPVKIPRFWLFFTSYMVLESRYRSSTVSAPKESAAEIPVLAMVDSSRIRFPIGMPVSLERLSAVSFKR